MSEARRAAPSGGLLLAVLALIMWRPELPGWAWALVLVVTALLVVTSTVGLVRDNRNRRGGDA